jgi:ribonuclease-3
MSLDLAALEAALGYEFQNRELLLRALTHKSRAYEESSPGADPADNEQFEFLGDAVLGFVVSDVLVRQFPAYREGYLTKLRAELVSEIHLHEAAQTLGLGDFLLLGRGEEMTGGRAKRALLADAMEAVLAAVYLDGGIEAARNVIERSIVGECEALDVVIPGINDYKSTLQHLAQSRHLPQPRYVIVSSNGPEHAKIFTVEARVGSEWTGRAEGPSKKSASQRAARIILEQINGNNETKV